MAEKEKPTSKRRLKGQQVIPELKEEMGYEAIDLLSPDMERFCWHYAKYGNGRAAYQSAYPDSIESTARVNASKLLTNTNIINRLNAVRVEMKEQYAVEAADVVQYHSAVLKFDRNELFDSSGSLRDLSELPMDVAALLDVDVQQKSKGGVAAFIKIPTRSGAAAELARIFGLYRDKLQLTGDVAQMSEEEMRVELARLAKETLDELNVVAGAES